MVRKCDAPFFLSHYIYIQHFEKTKKLQLEAWNIGKKICLKVTLFSLVSLLSHSIYEVNLIEHIIAHCTQYLDAPSSSMDELTQMQ